MRSAVAAFGLILCLVSTVHAGKHDLRLGFEKGMTTRWVSQAEWDLTGIVEVPDYGTMPVEMHALEIDEYEDAVLAVEDDGRLTIRRTYLASSEDVTSNGVLESSTPSYVGHSFDLSADGKVAPVGDAEISPEDLDSITPDRWNEIVPAKSVDAGDEWTLGPISVGAFLGFNTDEVVGGEAKAVLEKTEKLDGRKVATIGLELTFDGIDEEDGFELHLNLQGQFLLDLDARLPESLTLTGEAEVTGVIEEEGTVMNLTLNGPVTFALNGKPNPN